VSVFSAGVCIFFTRGVHPTKPACAPMKRAAYESVRTEDATPPSVDPATARFALAASVLGCAVSVAAIVYVVLSLQAAKRAA